MTIRGRPDLFSFLLNSSKLFIRECLVCAPFYRRFLHRVQRDDREASTIPGSRSPSDSLLYSLLLRLASICFHSRVLLFPFCGSEKGRYKSSACKFVCVCVCFCVCVLYVYHHTGEKKGQTEQNTQPNRGLTRAGMKESGMKIRYTQVRINKKNCRRPSDSDFQQRSSGNRKEKFLQLAARAF